MNNKAQFTLVCTCEIVMRTGETLDSSLGDRPCSDISKILLCPLHEAAPAMYEALSELVKYLREEVADEALDTWAPVFKAAMALAQARGEAECEGDTVEIKAAAVDISHIKAALAQAEGAHHE